VLANAVTSQFTTRDGAWGAAGFVETDNAGDAGSPQIAFDASGNALAVWHQSDGTLYHVWSNRYTAGSGWGTPELIQSSNADEGTAPQIAMDASGNALAVWSQSGGSVAGIWSNRYVAGSGWGTAVKIETETGVAHPPQIAVDRNGNALAVWAQSRGTSGTIFDIWSNGYIAGSGWGTATLIETGNPGHAFWPQVAFDTSGNALAVWSENDGTRYNIGSNRYIPGTGWGTDVVIETDNAGHAAESQIAFDASGNALVVWKQSDGTRNNIWSNRYIVGSGWSTAALIETEDTGDADLPQIAFDASGNALAVWRQSYGAHVGIWSNRYVVGSGWGIAVLIENDMAQPDTPQIAVDSSGNALAVWTKTVGTASTNIWSNRYTPGNGWGVAEVIENTVGNAFEPQIAIDAGGNAMAVWLQSDGTRNNIWFNRFE
jgi:hypothetical protein